MPDQILNNLSSFINNNQLLVGIILGWFITRVMEMIRKPNITFKISDDRDFAKGTKTYKFLNIFVNNNQQSVFKKFFFGSSSINNARVWIRFLDFSSKTEFLKINGRWASTKEPVDYVTNQPLIPEILLPSRDTIAPGEEAAVSIAIKESGEDAFFAFNNDSYLHSWKYLDYELSEKKYWVEIKILSDGDEYIHEFLLTNPSRSLRNFKLLEK
ncbi:hypothetical protein HYW42_05035 [Candidatus Daviesbacteria bacterium]|nr:hypothetical protein [Candidatus Daviesbacteria bacterium]